MAIVVVLAILTTAATAVRSTWSPCGLSMLSTVTPLAESGRGRRWSVTAAWFMVGALLGGITLGAGMAGLAAVLGLADLPLAVVLAVAAVAALVCAASDLNLFGWHLPFHGRQVNERWLDQYRAWVYGGGFGWQIGVGLATYITTSGLYLMILLAALVGSPALAFGLGVGFGFVRAAAILAGRTITSPESLLSVHRRFSALRQPVRLAVVATLLVVGIVAATAWVGVAGFAASSVVAVGIVAIARREHHSAMTSGPAVGVAQAGGVGPDAAMAGAVES